MPIKILPQNLINQIAAGEVVERPASVVKELVENSIDAGAKNITIEIENGGLNLVKVTDDGCGMNREDAEKCILQHATSKIENEEDLYKISSLGFRGEALSSISSVSEFTLITKDHDSLAGTIVEVNCNEIKINDIGCARGASVSAKNLFYNVPARRKYLKTVVTEFNHIIDLFLSYCLAFPEVSWKLAHNSKPVYQFFGADLKQRISDVLGDEIARSLIPIDLKINEIHLKGFIGKPQIARNNRKLQYLFVNNRPVNEYIVAKQIKDAYTTLISKDLYPVYILDLIINNEKVDVNVHPRKLEVRFSEPQIVYRTIYQAVSRMLDENDLIKNIQAKDIKRFVPVREVLQQKQTDIPITFQTRPRRGEFKTRTDAEYTRTSADKFLRSPISLHLKQEAVKLQEPQKEYRILSQIQNAYILVETENGLRIYDQHASSERVQYEKIKRQWQIGKLASQKMLLPQKIELTPIEARLINNNQEVFERLGFDISDFGGQTFAISAAPQFLVNENLKEVILEIIGNLEETIVVEDKIKGPIDNIFNIMACKSAIKFGDGLTCEGMESLINDLESLNNQYTCVHGRPCVIEFTFDELERMFKRK